MIIIYIIMIFLLGIIFWQWIIPLGEGVMNLFLTFIELLKSHLNVKIAQNQAKMKDDTEKNKTPMIGFTIAEDNKKEVDHD